LRLDCQLAQWFLSDDPQLSAQAKTAVEDPANVRWVSYRQPCGDGKAKIIIGGRTSHRFRNTGEHVAGRIYLLSNDSKLVAME